MGGLKREVTGDEWARFVIVLICHFCCLCFCSIACPTLLFCINFEVTVLLLRR